MSIRKSNNSHCWKHVHHSRSEAAKHIEHLKRKTPNDMGVMRVYWCDLCDGWHVGHEGPNKQKNLNKAKRRYAA